MGPRDLIGRRLALPRPRTAAAVAAALSLALGVGAMALLSASGRWTVGYSMWHYRAATWGDILLVPGICAVLAAGLCEPLIPTAPRERAWATAGGLAFGLAGALVQVSWLASAHPLLNWTLPAPHVFSFPGWYHAAYLVVASSAIGAAGAVLARRVQLAAPSVRAHVAALPATAASCGFGVSFGLVLWIDSIDSLHTSAGAGSALGALGAAVFTVVLATVVLGPRRAIQPLAAGALIAAVVFGGTVLTQGIPG